MLQKVAVGQWSLDAYEGIVPAPILAELREHARALKGARILHVEQAAYRRCIEENAATLDGGYDFIVIHDPQPAGLLQAYGKGSARWVWRCHIDTSEPNPAAWQFLAPYLEGFDAAVFTMAEFVPPDLPISRVETIAPAIDPLSPKNIALDPHMASQILDWIGMEIPGRLVTQISRFDKWKDPLGVIDAYRLVCEEIGGLQLALVGSMALDDPEGWDVYRQVSEAAERDELIHVYTNLTGVGNVEVNAFQRLSEVVVQKSIREGFGLVVSESLVEGNAGSGRSRRRHPFADARGCRRRAGRFRRGVRPGDAQAAE